MFKTTENTKQQGNVGVGRAIGWFTEQGYVVSIPLTDAQDYDLIVDIDNVLCKIQVKTTSYKNKYGIFNVNLSVKGGNRSYNTIKKFNKLKVQYLFVLTSDNTMYVIPTSDIKSVYNLNLGKLMEKYKVAENQIIQIW